MGKSQKAPSTQTVTNKTELPAWVDGAAQANLAQAQNVSAGLAQPYTGNTVAGINQTQADAWAMAGRGNAQAQPAFNAAQSALMGASTYAPSTATAQQVAAGTVTPTSISAPTIGARDVGSRDIRAQQIGALPQAGTSTIAADKVGAKSFLSGNIDAYMSPYTQSVVDASMSDLEHSRRQAISANGDAAARAGAFGGSRHGITEAVTNAETARAAGTVSANLRSAAFDKAAGLLAADNDNDLKAQLANQAAGLTAAQSNQTAGLDASKANLAAALDRAKSNQAAGLTAAQANQGSALQAALANQSSWLTADRSNQASALDAAKSNQATALDAGKTNVTTGLQAALANQSSDLQAQLANQGAGLSANGQRVTSAAGLLGLGQAQQGSWLQQASVNEGIGNRLQAQEQAGLDQAASQYAAARNYPLEQLNVNLAALGAVPYGQTSTTTGPSTQQGSNPLLGALGGAATGASIASTLGLTGMGSVAGAGAGGLLGLLALSDETEKTDKQRVGTDPATGLPLYSFRYKGDPKTYPKVVGPMAQDIEKKFPEQVQRVGGKLAVRPNFLAKVAA